MRTLPTADLDVHVLSVKVLISARPERYQLNAVSPGNSFALACSPPGNSMLGLMVDFQFSFYWWRLKRLLSPSTYRWWRECVIIRLRPGRFFDHRILQRSESASGSSPPQ